jgi:hypothetical protein
MFVCPAKEATTILQWIVKTYGALASFNLVPETTVKPL